MDVSHFFLGPQMSNQQASSLIVTDFLKLDPTDFIMLLMLSFSCNFSLLGYSLYRLDRGCYFFSSLKDYRGSDTRRAEDFPSMFLSFNKLPSALTQLLKMLLDLRMLLPWLCLQTERDFGYYSQTEKSDLPLETFPSMFLILLTQKEEREKALCLECYWLVKELRARMDLVKDEPTLSLSQSQLQISQSLKSYQSYLFYLLFCSQLIGDCSSCSSYQPFFWNSCSRSFPKSTLFRLDFLKLFSIDLRARKEQSCNVYDSQSNSMMLLRRVLSLFLLAGQSSLMLFQKFSSIQESSSDSGERSCRSCRSLSAYSTLLVLRYSLSRRLKEVSC